MPDPLSESEADTLLTQTRTGAESLDEPATHAHFLEFVSLMTVEQSSPDQAILVCKRTPEASPESWVLGDKFTLGKTPDCDLSVPEIPSLSRHHFVIERTPAGYTLTDTSRNGTFRYPGVERFPAQEPCPLKNGDVLWVEGMVFAFRGPESS